MLTFFQQPWDWYIAGPVIGILVPLLLLLGNKSFGVSSSFRHVCAAIFPNGIKFLQYDWKKEQWNLFFVAGVLLGSFIASYYLSAPAQAPQLHPELVAEMQQYGVTDFSQLTPVQLFSWQNLFTLRGFVMMIMGGFLIGFGSRYAGGCTSGHAIMGISSLQIPSVIATCCFMIGGFISANYIVPFILSL